MKTIFKNKKNLKNHKNSISTAKHILFDFKFEKLKVVVKRHQKYSLKWVHKKKNKIDSIVFMIFLCLHIFGCCFLLLQRVLYCNFSCEKKYGKRWPLVSSSKKHKEHLFFLDTHLFYEYLGLTPTPCNLPMQIKLPSERATLAISKATQREP